ncbi:MAG: aminoacyl--tRNA ligase-related protein [Candidatus Jordarchaeum sp.]|uniref:aminoacyl--tRNA ligase-related protein n=1 Tax=Candidatus Jordarchaeum sp. TaxID=2823881 RepID=UPI00404AE548
MLHLKLDGYIELGDDLPNEAQSELNAFFEDANQKLLKKGAPKGKESEAAQVTQWSLKGDKIELQIVSGRYVRPHSAILRLSNSLSNLLGAKYHVGVRRTVATNYHIETELEKEPLEQVTIPFTKELKIEGNKAYLSLVEMDESELKRNYPDRILRRLEEKVAAQYVTGKAEFTRTIERSKKGLEKYKIREDPTETAVKLGWVKEFPGAGIWQIMPPYAALIRAVENIIIDDIAKPLGFQEVMLPRLIPLDVEMKKGHLGIANEIIWACPPISRDPKEFEEILDYVEITSTPPVELLQKKLRPPMFGLSYAQCEPFYELFAQEIVDIEALEKNPIKFYDKNGPTWRWEGGGLKGLERLNEFHRVEFVYMAPPEKCVEIRDQVLEKAITMIDKDLDLEYRIDATTAVYLEHAGITEEEKEEEFVKTYDLTVILPFETKSRPEAELEISSFHVHTDFYAKRFHFRDKTRKTVYTGCVGIGPSRYAYVTLIRHGFNYDDWPKKIKKYIGEKLPEPPQTVTWP